MNLGLGGGCNDIPDYLADDLTEMMSVKDNAAVLADAMAFELEQEVGKRLKVVGQQLKKFVKLAQDDIEYKLLGPDTVVDRLTNMLVATMQGVIGGAMEVAGDLLSGVIPDPANTQFVTAGEGTSGETLARMPPGGTMSALPASTSPQVALLPPGPSAPYLPPSPAIVPLPPSPAVAPGPAPPAGGSPGTPGGPSQPPAPPPDIGPPPPPPSILPPLQPNQWCKIQICDPLFPPYVECVPYSQCIVEMQKPYRTLLGIYNSQHECFISGLSPNCPPPPPPRGGGPPSQPPDFACPPCKTPDAVPVDAGTICGALLYMYWLYSRCRQEKDQFCFDYCVVQSKCQPLVCSPWGLTGPFTTSTDAVNNAKAQADECINKPAVCQPGDGGPPVKDPHSPGDGTPPDVCDLPGDIDDEIGLWCNEDICLGDRLVGVA